MRTPTSSDMRSEVDLITMQVVREYLESVSEQMSTTLERTAMHPLFSEAHDFSTGVLFSDKSGVSLVARAQSIPVHIFAALLSVETLTESFKGDINDGDVIILNDPYRGGTHSADWTVMKPIQLRDGSYLYPSVRAHMGDFGGSVPGGYNPEAREIWQEGFRISPIKLVERGEVRRDIQETILANTRIPHILAGDLMAMVGACDIGETRIRQLLEKYGDNAVAGSVSEALDYAERRFRAELANWPNGDYEGLAILDHDSAGSRDIEVRTKITVCDTSLLIDFEGSSAQTPGFINSPLGNSASWAYTAICAAMPEDIPINSGIFRCVEINAPLATVVNPVPPAPVMATTGRIGGEIGNSVMKALEKIIPAAVGNVAIGGSLCTTYGFDHRLDEFYVTIEYGNNLVSAGAAKGVDGWGGWPTPFCALVFNNIEMLEMQFPVLYHQYEYTTDTAPAGQWRGLPAFAMKREATCDDQYVNVLVVGVRNRTPGWLGGAAGTPNRIWLHWNSENERQLVESEANVELRAGDILASLKSGGGGWGNPLERDPQAVLDDVLDELYTLDAVANLFGVVIEPRTMGLDLKATATLRAKRSTETSKSQSSQDSLQLDRSWPIVRAADIEQAGL